ncbi:helix-turn-helix transcriptional regulator [Litorimonas sp. RW-G-Af-16]|uniref:helix-turn-helix transcriptional regulator n=1 Tax=Litorimonas sp. RW-G-Af-16 TaxID=3241168 RepID=UPI00390C4333
MGGKKTQITNHIRRIRLARTNMTQVELAKRVGATRQTIIAIEANKYAPSLELAFRLAHTLGETVDDLFDFDPQSWS